MKKLLLLVAALLAFKGAKGAGRSPGQTAQRLSLSSLWPILLAPRWLRLPLLVRAVVGGGRRSPPRTPRR